MAAHAKPSNPNAAQAALKKKKTPGGRIKKMTPYNKFMRDEIARLKEGRPDEVHAVIFKEASGNWKTSKLNPKNKA